jgi:acylphosphatase
LFDSGGENAGPLHLDFQTGCSYHIDTEMIARAHIVVEGLVQGVGYRWFAATRAQGLGVAGFARNLFDGTVEVVAEGERSLIEEYVRDLRVGPRSAHVKNLRIQWEDPTFLQSGFAIK